mmetsp:Transcript_28558/g.91599  ORF Transcript_28558/g.91599 Transcript_28558/m.91599 type:complete len:342 (-) Transcript_28558:40-1065(-)
MGDPGKVQPDLLAEVGADLLERHVPGHLRDVHDRLLDRRELAHDVDGEVRVDDLVSVEAGEVEARALDLRRRRRLQDADDELDAVGALEDGVARRVRGVHGLEAILILGVVGAVDVVEGAVEPVRLILLVLVEHTGPLPLYALLETALKVVRVQKDSIVDAVSLLLQALQGRADLDEHHLEVVGPLELHLHARRSDGLRHAPNGVALDLLLDALLLPLETLVLVINRHGDDVVIGIPISLKELVDGELRQSDDGSVFGFFGLFLSGLGHAPLGTAHDQVQQGAQHHHGAHGGDEVDDGLFHHLGSNPNPKPFRLLCPEKKKSEGEGPPAQPTPRAQAQAQA